VPKEDEKDPERGAQRAARMVAAWSKRGGKKGGVFATRTRGGEVHLEDVSAREDANGQVCVDVTLAGTTEGGESHFVVYNPPLLATDPTGPIEINGRRFREDPLAALAEVVALNGGARTEKRKRRTQG
jgi:hypothetical protein